MLVEDVRSPACTRQIGLPNWREDEVTPFLSYSVHALRNSCHRMLIRLLLIFVILWFIYVKFHSTSHISRSFNGKLTYVHERDSGPLLPGPGGGRTGRTILFELGHIISIMSIISVFIDSVIVSRVSVLFVIGVRGAPRFFSMHAAAPSLHRKRCMWRFFVSRSHTFVNTRAKVWLK